LLVKEINTYYIIERIADNKTRLTIEVYTIPYAVIGKLIAPIFKKVMTKQLHLLLSDLENYCKQQEAEVSENQVDNINI